MLFFLDDSFNANEVFSSRKGNNEKIGRVFQCIIYQTVGSLKLGKFFMPTDEFLNLHNKGNENYKLCRYFYFILYREKNILSGRRSIHCKPEFIGSFLLYQVYDLSLYKI